MHPRPPETSTKQPEATLVCTKEPWKPSTLPRKIQKISFGVMSTKEVINTAELHVYERPLYSATDRVPVANGLLDLRLGISRKTGYCQTCGQEMKDCTGHFGYIHLELPVFHIGYFKITTKTLQCICKTCSRVLLPPEERLKYLRQFRSERTDRVRRDALFAAIVKKCRTQRQCPFCGSLNGPVKKVSGALKIVHEKYQKTDLYQKFLEEFSDAVTKNEFIEAHLRRASDDLNPIRVHALFSAVPDEECELLDLAGRPEDLIISVVQVPPVCIRPSVEVDGGGGSNEDDITVKLGMVIDANSLIRNALHKGSKMDLLMEQWDFLQSQCACFINSDLPGLPSQLHQAPGKPVKGFVQRLKGKQGRFRGNLSGKRVDFTGRTVISPDPNLRVDEVAVPMQIAMTLTYPEKVTPHNMERLKKCILNGVATWPGANMLTHADDGSRLWLKFGDRTGMAAGLKVGDTVERHLQDGDIVLFNRQPSLHRMSIMAHRVRVRPWRTLRFNECVCSPYNADFDGDEMNLHVPQTEEARAEALHLMGVTDNLCTPKNGEILIAATQDFLTSAFLLTSKDRFYTRADMGRLCAFMGDALTLSQLPVPALCKPVEMWTGKQVFSMLVRPNSQTRLFVNLETSEKIYKGDEHMCPMDGYVCFHNSELVCGRLGKATLGGGNKSSLFQVLMSDFSARAAAAVMNRLAKLSARFIGEQGFSIGIDDVTPAHQLQVKKQSTITESYEECNTLITQFKNNKLPLTAGCDMEGSLEAQVTGVLNNIRETVSKVCMSTLPGHNSPLIMSQCGSKGSPINIAQMVACVGQQVVSGTRAPNGFQDRSLPHFPRGDKTPAGKGFVANSFYSGLTPTEFFFHTMAGREGLVDTAVKTAETGYMSRRLMKALEDLYTHYDGTVRNAANVIVQAEYGDDGMDPVAMEGKKGEPVALTQKLSIVKAMTPKAHSAEPAPLPANFKAIVDAEIVAMEQMSASNAAPQFCSQAFRESLQNFLADKMQQWSGLRQHLGLPLDSRGGSKAETAASMLALSEPQIRNFIRLCAKRYDAKRMDAGSTVGAFGAQSIGEPGTQMTLKTFHFAGVAAMNVTLGVPRIREIINASKKISTPIISVALEVVNSESSARLVKARLEKTTLGQVAESISLELLANEACVSIQLNWKAIAALQLDVTPNSVANSLLVAPKLKLKQNHIRVDDFGIVSVHPPPEDKGKMPLLFQLQSLMQALPEVIVQGVPTIERAIVNKNKDRYELLVEGTDLRAVMGTQGVVGTRTTTNHVLEAASCLGIEAARTTIMKEIKYTMGQHGMAIDDRHTMLLADCMTFKGEVLGITRFGIAKMKDSVLNLASFEKTTDHLFDAALHGRTDEITGVSESIIMGIPMPTGTGLFKLRHSAPAEMPPPRPPPLLSY